MTSRIALISCGLLLSGGGLSGAEPHVPPRCEIVPLAADQVSLLIGGDEKTRWHFGQQYPRPFLYPLHGPAGTSLTRMGHPGAPNHDHHRSVWVAHYSVDGQDFWSDGPATQIRQKSWYCYRDGDDECVMASRLGWFGESGGELMDQDLIVAVSPLDDGESWVEIQLTLRPAESRETVTLGKTNFGILAVRVAKSISAVFGGGQLTSSEGTEGERQIFATQNRWVDYSGPIATGQGEQRRFVTEGITYFDHPDNPRYPSYWHVRDDGWMAASICMQDDLVITHAEPLTLRYLLHTHAGVYDADRATQLHHDFATRPKLELRASSEPHHAYTVERFFGVR